jgi:hypothetical protein
MSIETQQSALVPLDFDSLSPQDQFDRLQSVSEDYLFTVEARIARSCLDNVAADVARLNAIDNLGIMTIIEYDKQFLRAQKDTGMFTPESVQRALTNGVDGLTTFINNVIFAYNFSPSNLVGKNLFDLFIGYINISIQKKHEIVDVIITQYPKYKDLIKKNDISEVDFDLLLRKVIDSQSLEVINEITNYGNGLQLRQE